jgi:hypothetical protein
MLLCKDKPLNSYTRHKFGITSGKIARFRADSDPDPQLESHFTKGNNKTLHLCSGSMPFIYGSGSADTYH